MQRILNKVRKADIFAVPVRLTYKGEKSFNTIVGGCCSILLILGLLAYTIPTLHNLITNPVLSGNSSMIYFSLTESKEKYTLETNKTTLAVQLLHVNDAQVDSDFHVVFAQYNNLKSVYIPAVNCRDFFAKQMAESESSFFEN